MFIQISKNETLFSHITFIQPNAFIHHLMYNSHVFIKSTSDSKIISTYFALVKSKSFLHHVTDFPMYISYVYIEFSCDSKIVFTHFAPSLPPQ